MSGRQNSKPLSDKAIEAMKPGDKDKADIGEYRGLRVSCGRTGKKASTIAITIQQILASKSR